MTQPEALRLADALMDYYKCSDQDIDEAAAELRRLSAENKLLHERHHDDNVEYTRVLAQRDALLEALKGLVAWADDLRRDDPVEDLRKARAAIKAVEETK